MECALEIESPSKQKRAVANALPKIELARRKPLLFPVLLNNFLRSVLW